MNRRILTSAFLGFLTIIILTWSCTKLDTTNLGADLLPVVDNVNTFADTMDIEVFQEDFLPGDTTTLSRFEDHVLGNIATDPLFGTTNAQLFVQFKPNFYPFYFGNPRDTTMGPGLGFDSVILCLDYKGSWGDTSVPLNLLIKEIPPFTGGEWDSLNKAHRLTYAPPTGMLIRSAPYALNIPSLNSKVFFNQGNDSITRQIRIKLDSTWGAKLFYQDSLIVPRSEYTGNAFYNDSIFRTKFEGISVEATSGQALIYSSLNNIKSNLEFHYRYKRNNIIDTTYNILRLSTGFEFIPGSSTANKITRNRTIPGVGGTSDNDIYIQTTPGTYARLKIPRLNTFRDTNRIVHRAQIRVLQVPDNPTFDKNFSPPPFMYLDLRDSTPAVKHKPIYFDLSPGEFYNPDRLPTSLAELFFPRSVDFGYFGGFVKTRTDPVSGVAQSYYDFNVTRYLQRMIISQAPNKMPNYEMRLFAPYNFSYPQISPVLVQFPNNLAVGRVKVGGTSGSYKMQMVVIWSKVKVI